jgi:hypothetical protein
VDRISLNFEPTTLDTGHNSDPVDAVHLSARRTRFLALVRGAVVVTAILTWALTAPLFINPELQAVVGHDFAHFYTFGRVALDRDVAVLYDPAALHERQAALLPALKDAWYPPLYPPQSALLFAPLSLLSFPTASLVWACLSAAVYVGCVFAIWRRIRREIPDRVLVWASALAFPPFWYLILFRQNSIVVLAAFCVGWLALEANRPTIAGLAFGCLGFKPHFALMLAPVLLIRREWAIVRGLIASLGLQILAVVVLLGAVAFVNYVEYLPQLVATANNTEPLLYKSVSLRTVFRLLPTGVGVPLWICSVLVVLAGAIYVWRTDVPVRVRLAVVILGTVLVNPHMYVYDAVILAPCFLWLGAWYAERGNAARFSVQVLALAVAFWSLMVASLAFGLRPGIVAMVITVLLVVHIFLDAVRDVSRQLRRDVLLAASGQ